MKKKYVNVKFHILEEHYPFFYYFIEDYNIKGMEELLDEIMVCFEIDDWNDEICNEIIEKSLEYIPEISLISQEIIEDKNWNEEVEKNTPIIIVSDRIGIAPEWKKNEISNEIKIIINPKMSFGTGQHSTTKLVCSLMENIVQKGEFWIDAGCGTGILAILAMKLGAEKVFAFDNDEWSVSNSLENFELNDIQSGYKVTQLDMLSTELPKCDGIVANMFVNILDKTPVNFHNALKESKGDLILSGILKYDCDYIIDIYKSNNFELISKASEDEWVALHFRAV